MNLGEQGPTWRLACKYYQLVSSQARIPCSAVTPAAPGRLPDLWIPSQTASAVLGELLGHHLHPHPPCDGDRATGPAEHVQ